MNKIIDASHTKQQNPISSLQFTDEDIQECWVKIQKYDKT